MQATHVLLRFVLRFHTSGFWILVGSILLMVCLGGSFRYMQKAAEPTYGPAPDFHIVDGGADLTRPASGLSAVKDVFWASAIILVLVGLTDYAWILAAIVPIYAMVEVYRKYVKPMMGAMGSGNQAGTSSPQHGRAAQRSQRRKMKRFV